MRRLSALALFAIACSFSPLDTPMLAQSPSPDGTRIPTATLIVDNSLSTWTLASDRRVLRDGIHAASGYANAIYWFGGTIYVDGLDGNWYRWAGSSWTYYGTSAPTATVAVSPDKATVPTTTNAIVDSSLATWTLASDTRVLRNGVHAASGYGTIIYWYANTIYVFGTDSRWWTWNGSGWTVYGPSQPGTSSSGGSTTAPTVSPDRAMVPTTTNAIVDSSLATWTLAGDTRILRNGVHAANGYGTMIYWYSNTIYVFGTDSRWWTWNGSGWTVYGPSQPGTSSSGGSTTGDGSSPPTSSLVVSPDRATIPTTTNAIVDSSLATWTLASDTRVLRNGVHAANGYGTIIYWYSNIIYVFGTDSRWWSWNGSGWTVYGSSQPGTSSSGSGTSSSGGSTVSGDYSVSPGDDIQAVLDRAAEGNTIVLRAGVHRMQTLTPKSRQVISGEPGAILSGARRLTAFVWDGSYWSIAGQTQQGPATTLSDTCTAAAPLCAYPEDLFIDNVLLKHVATRSELGPGRWYFDYAADQIYLADDPTGHIVETSVTPTAVAGFANSVTIRGLVIEKFATPTQQAAVKGQGSGWVIESNEIRFNHAIGLRTEAGAIARNNKVHHNGSMGIAGSGSDILVENNEIAFNNTNGYNAYWEAGGTKWVYTNRLVVRGNYSHDNHGPGLWTDINNINTLYENNRVEDNDLSGIFHEISYAAVIRNNTIARNGRVRPSPGWVDGAGILVAGSSDVEVYGNTLTDNFQAIAGLEGHRGSGIYGPWVLQNLNVHDNSVWQLASMPNGAGRTGIIDTNGTGAFFNNNWWARNTYHLGTNPYYFIWMNKDINEATWPTYQQDTTGTFIR